MTLNDERQDDMAAAIWAVSALFERLGFDDFGVVGTASGEYVTCDIAVDDVLAALDDGRI